MTLVMFCSPQLKTEFIYYSANISFMQCRHALQTFWFRKTRFSNLHKIYISLTLEFQKQEIHEETRVQRQSLEVLAFGYKKGRYDEIESITPMC